MQTQEFLRRVWSDQGYYCIVGKDPQNIISPRFVSSIEEAEQVAQKFLATNNDVYFACSTFTNPTERTKANAREQRALWLDIDCGYDEKKRKYKDYKTKEEALVALRAFTDATGLPDPTIVDSGRGVHVYWTFTDPVVKELWLPVAEGLKFLCIKHGLKADNACTADMARILRVPGTQNFKDISNPQPVLVIVEGTPTPFDDLAGIIPIHIGTPKGARPRRELSEEDKKRKGNDAYSFKKIIDRCRAGDGCDQIAHVITKQATVDYNLWRAGLSVAAFCDDSDTAIHKISNRHPDYSFAATEAKAADISDSYLCETFESLRPEGCKNCKYKGTVRKPIELGRVVLKARGADNIVTAKSEELGELMTYQIPEYPWPYFRGKNGGVYRSMPDDEEDGIKVYEYDFYLVERLTDVNVDCAWFKLHLPQDGVREFIAPVASLMATDKARDILNNIGIYERGKPLEAIIDYIKTCLNHSMANRKTLVMHKQYGWNEQFNKVLIGNREISAFGVKYVPVSEELEQINPTLQKKGSYDEWKKAVSFYERPGMELRAFGFFCAFGSLLMPFFENKEKSAVVNLYNPDSGQGKTSIIQMMTSVYGNPDLEAKLINIWGDTENSLINRFGYMKNLASGVDEMTDVTPQQLHTFLKFVASGRGKNRLGNGHNRERVNHTTFNLICVVSSNTDFRTVLLNKNAKVSGEMARFIQLRIEEQNSLSKAEIDDLMGRIFENYGHAGEEYVQYLIANLDKVKQELKTMHQKIDVMLDLRGPDRKYSANLAAVFLGAVIAKRLGIHNIEIQPVLQAVAKEIKAFKLELKERDFDPVETLGTFLDENVARNTLVINSKTDSRSGMTDLPKVKPSGELKVRYEPDSQTIYIPCNVIKEYLNAKGVEYNDFVRGLKINNLLRPKSGEPKAMHKGLEASGPAVRSLWIDSSGFEQTMGE